jgi:osmotically-inducible protein OsmY
MIISKKFLAAFALLLLAFSTSCVETVVVGSVATGIVVTREKSFSNTRSDIVIATKLGTKFLENGLKVPGNSIDVTVNEGRVLLTGIVRNEQKAKLSLDLAWKVDGVKEVIDEIQLRDDFKAKDLLTASRDYLISTELEIRMIFAKDVNLANYQITTVGRTVYLLGVAQSNDEMQKAVSIASKVRGVDKVVNHIILVNDRRRNG